MHYKRMIFLIFYTLKSFGGVLLCVGLSCYPFSSAFYTVRINGIRILTPFLTRPLPRIPTQPDRSS
jgi:hypothetical protein